MADQARVRLPSLRIVVAAIATAVTVGCNGDAMIRRLMPAGADARARAYIELFTRRQVDSAVARLVPQLGTSEAREELGKIAEILADQQFDSVRVIGTQVNTFNGIRHLNLSYELHSRAGWFVANVATVDSANTWAVEGVSARRIERSLEELTRFSLTGKSALHYLWLLLTVAAATLSLGGMIFIATRRGMPKRWRWALACLVGVSPLDLNWASGTVGVRTLSIQFGSAAFLRAGPAAPWIITFALPLGAIIALGRYRRWRFPQPAIAGPALGSAPPAAIDDATRARLLTPDWDAVARRIGRPVPPVIRELYAAHSLLTGVPLSVIGSNQPGDATGWEIAAFQPADSVATEHDVVGMPANGFHFATSSSGDAYYMLVDAAADDGPVFLLRHGGTETVLVAETLRQFLAWPRRSTDR